ncbi:MAG: TolC family protein [Endomicrobiia bacterium]|nr:TolC family protein [Endomicrobiia bacterium]
MIKPSFPSHPPFCAPFLFSTRRMVFAATLIVVALFSCRRGALSAEPPVRAPASAVRIFSVADAVFYGIRNNQQILVANEEIEIARAKIRETHALVFPKIDFNLNASKYETATPFVLSDALGSIYYDARRSPSENYTAKFTLAQYLYAGGRYTSNMRLARTNMRVAETNKEILVSHVRAEVKKAFYRLIHALARLDEMKKEAARLELSQNSSDKDILISLKRDILMTEKDSAAERLGFLSAAGLELNTFFETSGTLEKDMPSSLDADKLVAQAYQYRRELSKVAIQETIDSLAVSLLQTERFPAVSLGGTYELVDINRSDSRKNWAMFMNLNLPIFDGWASWARLDSRKSHARQSAIRKTDAEDSISYEVRLAVLNCETSAKKVKYDAERLAAILSSPSSSPRSIFLARLDLLDSRLWAVACLINLELAVGKEIL